MITRDDLRRCTTRFSLHLDGQGFFENHLYVVEHPRLTIVQRGPRGRRSGETFTKTFFVDGIRCDGLDDILARLNANPALSAIGGG